MYRRKIARRKKIRRKSADEKLSDEKISDENLSGHAKDSTLFLIQQSRGSITAPVCGWTEHRPDWKNYLLF